VLQIELCSPKIHVEVLTPVLQNVIIFGDRAFKDMIKVKNEVMWVDPNPCNWCPYKKDPYKPYNLTHITPI